jgi:hypothetical protein
LKGIALHTYGNELIISNTDNERLKPRVEILGGRGGQLTIAKNGGMSILQECIAGIRT